MRSKAEVSVIRCWHSADDPQPTFESALDNKHVAIHHLAKYGSGNQLACR